MASTNTKTLSRNGYAQLAGQGRGRGRRAGAGGPGAGFFFPLWSNGWVIYNGPVVATDLRPNVSFGP